VAWLTANNIGGPNTSTESLQVTNQKPHRDIPSDLNIQLSIDWYSQHPKPNAEMYKTSLQLNKHEALKLIAELSKVLVEIDSHE